MQNNIVDITLDNFQQVMLEDSQHKLILVEFWQAGVEPCEQMAPLLANLAAEYAQSVILARVNCDEQQQVVMQFGVRSLPTVMLVKNGQPIDGAVGPQSEADLRELLCKHLPKPEELLLEQASATMEQGDLEQAAQLAKQAYDINSEHAPIKLLLADIYIQLGHIEPAKALLSTITMVDQDHNYQRLLGLIELAEQAADTPEIQALQQQLQSSPDNNEIKIQLAVQLQQAKRNEEALSLLFDVLKQDLNFGEARKFALDIINGLPAGDPLAGAYRRKIYSLLY
ncbi:thioredoxin family protein [Neptunicella marina]|uniref:Co-chaperone YbbN n=1 Tax=Neptunicella marina TaxID=2125989 RepID=A0A8J6J0E8_9ALTE|nr:co-chaperone YbbN [Neptunicella marina]MBC3767712.1 co-chaperone YbbN [Neptunicella marina]